MSKSLTVLDENFYNGIKKNFVSISNEKTFKKEVNFAVQIFKKNPYLQTCDANSVLDAVLNVSQTGLTLNPVLNYAYLVPMKGKCVLIPGYQGLIKLATDTDAINSIEVQLIYEGDDVVLDMASDKKVKKHIPYILTGKEKGDIIGGYSVANLSDGTKHIEIMSLAQIHDVRACSETYKSYVKKKAKGEYATSVWVSDPEEMSRKTIVRRHFKYLPKSNNKQLEKAIELDNEDYDFPITMGQANYIESLLMTSSIDEKTNTQIYNTIDEMTQKRAEECIVYLQQNQRDPISQGTNYSQTDIKNKLSEKLADPKA